MRNHAALIGVAVLLVIGLCFGSWYLGNRVDHPKPSDGSASASKATQYTPLSITLHGGQLVSPAATYVVKQGTGLEFNITSNLAGKIQVPTVPAKTITFTESPLIFRLTASRTGTYQLKYLASGSRDIIVIGTIVVRS